MRPRLASTRPKLAKLNEPMIVPSPGAAARKPNPDAPNCSTSLANTGSNVMYERPKTLKQAETIRKVTIVRSVPT